MSQPSPTAPVGSGTAAAPAPVAKKPQNPALRMLGLPAWRPKLPSRNWMIFLTIVGSWTGALLYDRREKKKVQQKWTTLVSHIAHQNLDTHTLPRRVTIYLAAPPGDSLRSAREHFVEYVKPVLVAGGLEWDVVEGRREGEVRAGLAERIRRLRQRAGESSEASLEPDVKDALDAVRLRNGVRECPELQGDVVIGRHTWKEYVRGLHEGWLGPLDAPKDLKAEPTADETKDNKEPPPTTPTANPIVSDLTSDLPSDTTTASTPDDDASPTSKTTDNDTSPPEPPEKPSPPKPTTPPTHLPSSLYPQSQPSPYLPRAFQPVTTVTFPHLLGFLNTPIRMYRFLNRRRVADDTARSAAALVLASYRPFNSSEEIREILKHEESNWKAKHLKQPAKSEPTDDSPAAAVDEPSAAPIDECEWSDSVVLDARISDRMRRFELDDAQERRASRIAAGAKGVDGRPDLAVAEAE